VTMRNKHAVHIDTTDLERLIEDNPRWGMSNLDLIAERRGKFLVQEWKRPGEEMLEGQRLLLKALSSTPGFTVLIVTGDTDNGTEVAEVRQVLVDRLRLVGTTLAELQEFIRSWYREVQNA